MNNVLIFLDDERYPEDVTWINYPEYDKVVIVRDSVNFKKNFHLYMMKETNSLVEVSFDHDIQDFFFDEETTGYDLLKWMVDYCFEWGYDIPECYFHTQNNVGKRNMESYYINAVKFQKEK